MGKTSVTDIDAELSPIMTRDKRVADLPSKCTAEEKLLGRLAMVHKIYAVLVAIASLVYLAGASYLMLSAASYYSAANLGVAVGSLLYLAGMLGFAYLNWRCANALRDHSRPQLISFVSGLNVMMFPLGTGLGIYTYRVLGRPQIAEMFGLPLTQRPAPAQVEKQKSGIRLVTAPEPTAASEMPLHEALAYADAQEEALWKEIEDRHHGRHQSGGDNPTSAGST
jgi:hypothetical protein